MSESDSQNTERRRAPHVIDGRTVPGGERALIPWMIYEWTVTRWTRAVAEAEAESEDGEELPF